MSCSLVITFFNLLVCAMFGSIILIWILTCIACKLMPVKVMNLGELFISNTTLDLYLACN